MPSIKKGFFKTVVSQNARKWALVLIVSWSALPFASGVTFDKIDFSQKSRMVIFGDSLSDYGNTGTVNTAYKGWSFEAEVELPNIPGWPSPYDDVMRFTNANLWSVYVSEMINAINPGFARITDMDAIRALPYNPYYGEAAEAGSGVSTGQFMNNPSGHQNWAWGGAKVNTSPEITATWIDNDHGYVLSSVAKQIEQAVISSAANLVDPGTVVFIWAGANDYVLYGDSTSPLSDLGSLIFGTDPPPANLGVTAAEAQLENIQTLIDLGVKDIVVMNLPDISKTPGAIAGDYANASQTLTPGQFTLDFNTTLANGLTTLLGDANIVLIDIFSTLNTIIANPGEFGLNPAYLQMSAVVNEGDQTPHFNSLLTPEQIAQNNFEGWLFWDHVHPTETGHYYLAQAIYDGAAIPEPSSFVFIGFGVIALGTAWKRRKAA